MGQLAFNLAAAASAKAFTVSAIPTGFKVVMATGFTSKTPTNPCLSCKDNHGQNKEFCSEFCSMDAQRTAYLSAIGCETGSGTLADIYGEANGEMSI